MAKGLKDPCPHVAGVGGQYKMYNSLIFINFISRSKKVKPKMLSCVWSLCSANKLLRLWHFVSVHNLKFLDQLERRHCKDTPYFRPFYITAPNRPFLWGLKLVPVKSTLKVKWREMWIFCYFCQKIVFLSFPERTKIRVNTSCLLTTFDISTNGEGHFITHHT
jgi:hypothetical protein